METLERLVFQSPKRHRIIAVKKLLAQNEIPVTSVKLYIQIQWNHGGIKSGQAGQRITETMERRNELNVPIEEFDEKLNDAQTFELYTTAQHEEAAIALIESRDEESFFGDCIFRSDNYDEAFEVYTLLNKNNIPCADIVPGTDAYLLFIDPEDMDKARALIKRKYGNEDPPPEDRPETYRKTSLFKTLFS